jgi:hypothetical protein
LEYTLTRQVVQEIETKSHYKVVSRRDCADTELLGTIVNVNKGLLNINPNNEVRQAETQMGVEVVWRDLRTGEILSGPAKRPDVLPFNTPTMPPPTMLPGTGVPFTGPGLNQRPDLALTSPDDPDNPKPPPKPTPVMITSSSTFVPELGQSITTSLQGNMELIATQIVSMMEAPW